MTTPPTNSTSLSTAASDTNTPTFTVPMTATSQTTAVDTSMPDTTVITPDTTVITTANTSHTANTTSNSDNRITHGVGFNNSEKNITIVFSVALGALAVAFVIFMFHRCKQRAQYLHQPFYNSDEPDTFVAGDDTLVISGGLYDGHPIYDNVPTVQEDQSQFRLQFFH
ncbi:sialomucin core protein 24-like [Solea solea]|uniref:sialomucin core protein 24-like n=1 Tax=Solea solea TaxID=90069 RepID=UPI00272D9285|nr:sialomucin core protein 24-like [Solea solea]